MDSWAGCCVSTPCRRKWLMSSSCVAAVHHHLIIELTQLLSSLSTMGANNINTTRGQICFVGLDSKSWKEKHCISLASKGTSKPQGSEAFVFIFVISFWIGWEYNSINFLLKVENLRFPFIWCSFPSSFTVFWWLYNYFFWGWRDSITFCWK